MVDLLSPSRSITLRRRGPTAPRSVSTAVCGLQGVAAKGPKETITFVAGLPDFEEIFGGQVASAPWLYDGVKRFFNNGGAALFINRIVGTGAAAGTRTLTAGGPAGAAVIQSGVGPFVLDNGLTVIGSVVTSGGAPAAGTVTIQGTVATLTCTGGTYAAGAGGDSVTITIGGVPGSQVIDLSSVGATQQAYCDALNAGLVGAKAAISAGDIVITTDRKGSGASGSVTAVGGAAAAKLGVTAPTAFTNAGPNNVVDTRQVTAAELVVLFEAAFAGTTSTATAGGVLVWTHDTAGATSTLQISGGTGRVACGFTTTTVPGTAATTVNTIRVDASYLGLCGYRVRAVQTSVSVATATARTAGATTTIAVSTTSRILPGDQISVTAAGGVVRGTVQSVDGINITFTTSVTVPAGGFAGTETVTSEMFDLYVYDESGSLMSPSPFRNLRMSALAGRSYFVNAVNSASRTPVTLTNLNAVTDDSRPTTDASPVVLTGGLAGVTPTPVQFIGSASTSTGYWAWGKEPDINFFASPGVCDLYSAQNDQAAIMAGLSSFLEGREDMQAPIEGPSGLDSTQIRAWLDAMGLNTKFIGLYWPWHKDLDPVTSVVKAQPPSPAVLARISVTHASRHFAKAPAGEVEGKVDIVGVEYEVAEGSPEYNTMYPDCINAVIKLGGDGFAIWGDKTLDRTGEFANWGTVTGFCQAKRLFLKNTRWVVFEPNDADTRAGVVRILTAIFSDWRLRGILKGASDDEAFFIICDETNNTAAVIEALKLRVRIGLAFNKPAEFIEGTLEQDTRAVDKQLAIAAQ